MQSDILDILYKKYYAAAYHYTLSLCSNKEIAEDIVSKAFIRAFVTIEDYRKDFKFWLLRVCKNLWIDEVRKRKYLTDEIYGNVNTIVSSEDIENKFIISERNKILYQTIMELKQNYREVLILFYFADQSIRSISDITKNSIGSVKTILFRARLKLKGNLEEKGYEF